MTARRAATEVAKLVMLGRQARALLTRDHSAGAYLQTLLREEQWVDAIRYLARGLPPRKAVWWACLCARHAVGEAAPPAQTGAIRAATRWVLDPSEANRKTAEAAGKKAGANMPAGCAAQAAARADNPADVGRLAAAAVLLAAAAGDDLTHHHRQYLYIGLDVENDTLAVEG
jgi:hypothetical protein